MTTGSELDLLQAARLALAFAPSSEEFPQSIVTEAGLSRIVSLLGYNGLVIETRPVALDASSRHAIASVARQTEVALRELSSEKHLVRVNYGRGFRIEDVLLLELEGTEEALPALRSWWRRRLLPETIIDTHPSELFRARAVFTERGVVPTSQRKVYSPDPARGGRIRVEAFELHVTEHCNLRCEHCCNSSPYLPHKALTLEGITETLSAMSEVIYADVFKIMGGEPLLHPRISEVLRVVKESGVSDVVRLFTNGLLLSKMKDDFWRELDQLTVSSYASAPVRRDQLAYIEHKAHEFDVILNIKPVEHFSQVAHDARREDQAEVEKTWQKCWLRHRCLVAREGRFYICTRAAYLDELHQHVALDQPFADPQRMRSEDSVALDDPDLQAKMLALLNRDRALHSCQFCLGGEGPREVHAQLTRADVKAGRLRRLQVLP
jgi:organic radical activating enzyme